MSSRSTQASNSAFVGATERLRARARPRRGCHPRPRPRLQRPARRGRAVGSVPRPAARPRSGLPGDAPSPASGDRRTPRSPGTAQIESLGVVSGAEAATRDDAIAAAREQFGLSAAWSVSGASGGVLGFFATERYVAEVAPDLTNRPAVPPAATQDDAPAMSPSAAPARARATAPARNGAAARAAAGSAVPAPARRSGRARGRPPHPHAAGDDGPGSASLLLLRRPTGRGREFRLPPLEPRATFPRTAPATSSRAVAHRRLPAAAGRDADRRVLPPTCMPPSPSPRPQVVGDQDVRQAVEEGWGPASRHRVPARLVLAHRESAAPSGAPGGGTGGRTGRRALLEHDGGSGAAEPKPFLTGFLP